MRRSARLAPAAACIAAGVAACVLSAGALAAGGGSAETLAKVRLYDDTGNPANTYYAAQGGAEALDDIHLAAGGFLDSLVFESYDPASGGTISATVNLYANPGGLDLGASLLAGPFVVNGIPRGRSITSVALPHLATGGASLWVGIQFSSVTAGWILKDVPSVGTSHDLYLENGAFYWFGGSPKANFGLRLVGAPSPLAVGDDAERRGVALEPPEPNPFTSGTRLSYSIARPGFVRVEVLDLAGRSVRLLVEGWQAPGRHVEHWSGRDDAGRLLHAGVYFVRLEAAGRVAARRVVFTP